jgi:hypothetical protein
MNEGRERKEAIKFASSPSLPSLPANFCDSLRGSNSHISEAKNADATRNM